MSDALTPARMDGPSVPSGQTQWNAGTEEMLAGAGSAKNRIAKSVISPGNLIAQGTSAAAKGMLGALNPAAAVGVLTNAATEAVNLSLEHQHRVHGINIDKTASLLLEAAIPMMDRRTEAFLSSVANDANVTTPAETMRAWADLQDGFKAAEKWWLPVGIKLRLRKGRDSGYYRMGLEHGHEMNRLFRNDPSWKEVSAHLTDGRNTLVEAALAGMFAGQIQGIPVAGATGGGSSPAALGTGQATGAIGAIGGVSAVGGTSTAGLASGGHMAGGGAGGGVGDVLSAANASIEQIREALLLTAQAQEILDEVRRIFGQGAEGSTEQGPKDVLNSYGDADEDLDSATALMYGAERNAVEWTAHL
jgi:hypothetical protein